MAEFMKHSDILLKKAKVDLRAAKNLYSDISRGDKELDYEVVLFHLHQAAEKLIKSLLASHKIDYPKVHDLELLAGLLNKNNIQIDMDIETLGDLSDYAVEGRYAFLQENINGVEKYIQMLDKAIADIGNDS